MKQQSKYETDHQSLADSLSMAQRKLTEQKGSNLSFYSLCFEKLSHSWFSLVNETWSITTIFLLFLGRFSDLNIQLKTAKSQADSARQDLIDYKDKAARILLVWI